MHSESHLLDTIERQQTSTKSARRCRKAPRALAARPWSDFVKQLGKEEDDLTTHAFPSPPGVKMRRVGDASRELERRARATGKKIFTKF